MGHRSGHPASGRCDRVTSRRMRQPFRRGLLTVLSLLGLLALSMQACWAEIRLTQASGDTLVLPAPAKRIITLAPNLAELVFAAGAGNQLIAVGAYSDYPPPVKALPSIGDAFRIDLESILSLQPDLVIAWPSGNPQAALQKLTELGVTVWEVEITRPEDIANVVEAIALAAGTESEGVPEANRLRQRLASLIRQNQEKEPLDFFYQIASEPLYTVSSDHIISQSMELCGGRNVFAELATLAPQVTRESVIQANPDVMISGEIAGQAPALENWQSWPNLKAVKTSAFIYIPADDISRAGPRLLDGIELACERFDSIRASAQ